MPDKVGPGPLRGDPAPREAVCIHTKKVYDSCKDKDCIDGQRVYLTRASQAILDTAVNVKPRSAELIWAYLDVEPIAFNRGFYTVDVKYFYRVTADAFSGVGRPRAISGLATFDKRTVLFGSEGSARIFISAYRVDEQDQQLFERTNLPVAVVEVVDPVLLGCKFQDNCPCEGAVEFPESICQTFDDELVVSDTGRSLYVTLGQFSIIKLERDIQLLMPAYDICLPEKECPGTDDPCSLFESFQFPVDEFYPPKRTDLVRPVNANGVPIGGNGTGTGSGCGCKNRR